MVFDENITLYDLFSISDDCSVKKRPKQIMFVYSFNPIDEALVFIPKRHRKSNLEEILFFMNWSIVKSHKNKITVAFWYLDYKKIKIITIHVN